MVSHVCSQGMIGGVLGGSSEPFWVLVDPEGSFEVQYVVSLEDP